MEIVFALGAAISLVEGFPLEVGVSLMASFALSATVAFTMEATFSLENSFSSNTSLDFFPDFLKGIGEASAAVASLYSGSGEEQYFVKSACVLHGM